MKNSFVDNSITNNLSLNELIETAEQVSWKEAIYRFGNKINSERPDFPIQSIVDESLADFRFLIASATYENALSIGTDWGAITVPLARSFRFVYSLDFHLEPLRFTIIRAQQEGIKNILPIHSSSLPIPLTEDTCELVVLHDALEWIPMFYPDTSPIKIYSKVIKDVSRVLKSNGYLYISMENRYGFNYFLGAKDLHTGLRFITLLPRKLADIYIKIIRQIAYREWTLSLFQIKEILQQYGFTDIKTYYILPGYRDFSYIVDSANKDLFKFTLTKLQSHASFRAWQHFPSLLLGNLVFAQNFFPRFAVLAHND